ncbi:MAG: DUF1622 domain-containing protein [Xenococcus sp. (in: cyanobacteria)]
MLIITYLLTNVQEDTSVLVIGLETLMEHVVFFLEVTLEIIAILIIATAIFTALQRLLRRMNPLRNYETWESIRLELALALALSLEFLLAADIVATAVSPSWDAIGKLGAITGIRTFLNFFLQKEVQELEAKTQKRKISSKANNLPLAQVWQGKNGS